MAKRRTNVIRESLCFIVPHGVGLMISHVAIVEDARLPQRYRMLLSTVDVIFADVAQPDQARIVAVNAHNFLKNGGHAVISIKANCIDSTVHPAKVFAREVEALRKENFKPIEQVTLEPYERDHAMVSGKSRKSSVLRSILDPVPQLNTFARHDYHSPFCCISVWYIDNLIPVYAHVSCYSCAAPCSGDAQCDLFWSDTSPAPVSRTPSAACFGYGNHTKSPPSLLFGRQI